MARSEGEAKQGVSRRPSAPQNICLMVVGMHRSGTSALARTMSLLGADLPRTLMQGTDANKASNATGHWESEAAARLGDTILDSAGTDWRSPEPVAASWYRSARYAEMRDRAVALLQEEFGGSPLFVFKDPRVCKLLPFWLDVLDRFGAAPKVVSIIRSPLEVAASLQVRNDLHISLGQILWLRYVLDGEVASRTVPRTFVSYDHLLSDAGAVAARIGTAFDMIWPRASVKTDSAIAGFLSKTHRHHVREPDIAPGTAGSLSSVEAEVYSIFKRWAQDGEASDDCPALDRSRANLDCAVALLGEPLYVAMTQGAQIKRLKSHDAERSALLRAAEEKAEALALSIAAQGDAEQRQVAMVAEMDALRERLASDDAQHSRSLTEYQDARIALARLEEKLLASEAARTEAGHTLTRLTAQIEDSLVSQEVLRASLHAAEVHQVRVEMQLASAEAALQSQLDAISELQAARDNLRALEQERDAFANIANQTATERDAFAQAAEMYAAERNSALAERDAFANAANQTATERDAFAQAAEMYAAERDSAVAEREALSIERYAAAAERDTASANLSKMQVRATELQHELSKQISIAADRQEAIQHLRQDRARKVAERDGRNKKLLKQIDELQHQLSIAHMQKLPVANAKSRQWSFQRLIGLPRSTAAAKKAKRLAVLRTSDLFDPWWYLAKYEDVRSMNLDPADHYLDHGGREGRSPGPGFDSRWYLEVNPDVRESGENPLIHYLEHGRLEGREIRSLGETKRQNAFDSERAPLSPLPAVTARVHTAPASADRAPSRTSPPERPVEAASDSPWVGRALSFATLSQVADFDRPLPSTKNEPEGDDLMIAGITVGRKASDILAGQNSAEAACVWFARIGTLSVTRQGIEAAAPDQPLEVALRRRLCDDALSLEDMWFDTPGMLQLRLHADSVESALFLRGFQQDAEGHLRPCGEAVLTASGQIIAQLRLHAPWHPLLLVVVDADNRIVDSMLAPFPSLYRGAPHFGELAAGSDDFAAMDAARDLARHLLENYISVTYRSSAFAISTVTIDATSANGTETSLSRQFLSWLVTSLGVRIALDGRDDSDPAQAAFRADIAMIGEPKAARKDASTLSLPSNAIPTLTALFARAGELADSACHSIYMHATEPFATYSLAHAVVPGTADSPRGPSLALPATVIGGVDGGGRIDVPLALCWPPTPATNAQAFYPSGTGRVAASGWHHTAPSSLAIIIDCADAAVDLLPLLASIKQLVPDFDLERILLINSVGREAISVDLGFDVQRMESKASSPVARYLEASRLCAADRLLLLDENVVLHDHRVGAALRDLCATPGIGSATCTLVSEIAGAKGTTSVQRTAGWIIMTDAQGGSYFAKPDLARHALAPLFPVVAPDLRCTMIDRLAFQERGEGANDELSMGLAFHDADLANICLSFFTATCATTLLAHADSEGRAIPPCALRLRSFAQ